MSNLIEKEKFYNMIKQSKIKIYDCYDDEICFFNDIFYKKDIYNDYVKAYNVGERKVEIKHDYITYRLVYTFLFDLHGNLTEIQITYDDNIMTVTKYIYV